MCDDVTCAECGGVLRSDSGSFRSPQHPEVYPHGVNCTWFIHVQSGFIIQLTFDSFLLERNYRCRRDYVEIFDSHTSQHSLGRYAAIVALINEDGISLFLPTNPNDGRRHKSSINTRAFRDCKPLPRRIRIRQSPHPESRSCFRIQMTFTLNENYLL